MDIFLNYTIKSLCSERNFFVFVFCILFFFLGLLFIYLNFYYSGILKKVFNLYRLVFIYSVLRDFHVVED